MSGVALWRPPLEGPLRDQALDAIRDIAEALRDPAPPEAPEGGGLPEAAPLKSGLCTGRAGIAVFFAYVARAALMDEAEHLARHFLNEAETGLATQRMGLSLCEGFSGIAWAHAHIHRRLGWKEARGSLTEVDETLLALLPDWPWPTEFDLLYGLVGIGVYALERLPSRAAQTMARLVVERLAENAVRIDGLAGWATPPGENAFLSDGELNLGLAHGSPGVIGFLGRAAAAGIAPRMTIPLLRQATRWLLARQLPRIDGSAYPQYCDRSGRPGPAARTAWCYGDPGVAAALLAAGCGADDVAWQDEAIRIARVAAGRPLRETRCVDAGLCHGSAGIGQIFNRLYQATGEALFREAAVEWFQRTLAFRQPDQGIAGFVAMEGPSPAGMRKVSDPGVLTGAAGIGLALLAASTPVEPAWDRMLLLDLGMPG